MRLRSTLAVFLWLGGGIGARFASGQTPEEIAAWQLITRWQGHYECERVATREHRVDGRIEEAETNIDQCVMDFELQRDPKSGRYNTTQSRVTGSYREDNRHEWGSFGFFQRHHGAAEYRGQAQAKSLTFDRKWRPGSWQFIASGDLAQAYTINYDGDRFVDLNYPEENGPRQWTRTANDFAHSTITGKFPAGPPGVLTGTWRMQESSDRDEHKTFDSVAHVILTPVIPELDLIVTIEGTGPDGKAASYDSWLPGATLSSDAPGAHLMVTAHLRARDGARVTTPVKEFRFELHETSREPGVCLNFPLLATDGKSKPPRDPLPDLRWDGKFGATDAYATPVHATAVGVRQNLFPGTVVKIEAFSLDGKTQIVWSGRDSTPYPANQIGWVVAKFDATPFLVQSVKLTLKPASVPDWNEIDAVQLVGEP